MHSYKKIFFLLIRTFKIYSLSNFQMCNMLIMVTMLYIVSPWLIYFIAASLTLFTHFASPLLLGNHWSVLCIYKVCFILVHFVSLALEFRAVRGLLLRCGTQELVLGSPLHRLKHKSGRSVFRKNTLKKKK